MISISTVEILRWTSTLVSISVKFVLAGYFLMKYSHKRMTVPLVWGIGFFFFGFSQVPILIMRYFRDPTTNMAFALLGAFIAILSLAFLYYGASLLFFAKGSFMQKPLSLIFFVVMLVCLAVFPFMIAPENILRSIFFLVATGFIFSLLLIVALIFFVTWRHLEPDIPRRPNVLFVAVAWAVYAVTNGLGSFSVGTPFEWIFYVVSSVAFLFLLYGMTAGKATGEH